MSSDVLEHGNAADKIDNYARNKTIDDIIFADIGSESTDGLNADQFLKALPPAPSVPGLPEQTLRAAPPRAEQANPVVQTLLGAADAARSMIIDTGANALNGATAIVALPIAAADSTLGAIREGGAALVQGRGPGAVVDGIRSGMLNGAHGGVLEKTNDIFVSTKNGAHFINEYSNQYLENQYGYDRDSMGAKLGQGLVFIGTLAVGAAGAVTKIERAMGAAALAGETVLPSALQTVAPRAAPTASSPLRSAVQALRDRNETITASRLGSDPIPGPLTQRLSNVEDVLNQQTASLRAAREIDTAVKTTRYDPQVAQNLVRSGVRTPDPETALQAFSQPRAPSNPVTTALDAAGKRMGQWRDDIAQAASNLYQQHEPAILADIRALASETARARELLQSSPTLNSPRQAFDTAGALFNRTAASLEPVTSPIVKTAREGGGAIASVTSIGVGYGAVTGQLSSGSFRQGNPTTPIEDVVADYVNMPNDLNHHYVGFWPTDDARGASFFISCGSKTTVGDYPLALLPGQRGATPRSSISHTGSSFTANSTLIGPAMMCSFNSAWDTNHRASFTVVAMGGRVEKPNVQVRTSGAADDIPSSLVTRGGVNLGLGALVATTDLAWEQAKFSGGHLLSAGSVGLTAGSDGVRMHLSPVVAEPYFSATTNSSYRRRHESSGAVP